MVIRQLVVASGWPLTLAIADTAGRVDAFSVNRAAFQIKHSSKRLSPWQFTYMPETIAELQELRQRFDPVWAFLVCGHDGVVGLSLEEILTIAYVDTSRPGWIRVRRNRNSMYRVTGAAGELPRAKARGVETFLSASRANAGELVPS